LRTASANDRFSKKLTCDKLPDNRLVPGNIVLTIWIFPLKITPTPGTLSPAKKMISFFY